MVKKKISLILALGAFMAMGHVSSPFSAGGLKESATDFASNKGVGLHVLRAEGGEVEHSQTYAQYGMKDGHYVLRFATAVKGAGIESLSYTRFAVEGADPASQQGKDVTSPVTVLYKTIETDSGNAYYNGEGLVYESSEAPEGWYWACYSITFTSSTYYAKDIKVELTINDSEKVESKSMSLNEARKLPNFEAYVGNKYSGTASLEVLDKNTAKCTYGSYEVQASITGVDGEFLVFGDSNKGFKALIQGSTAHIKDFMYEGEKKTGTTYYSDLLVRLTGDLRVKFDKDGYQYVDTSKTFPYYTGESQLIYIYPTPTDADITLSYSADNSIVSLSNGSETGGLRYVKVLFNAAGSVNVTITVIDSYGTSKFATVKFNVTEAVYPTEDDFEISYTVVGGEKLGDLKVNGRAQFEVKWNDGGRINQSKDVTWSVASEDANFATISNASDTKGLLSAKKAGTITVYASVTGANGKINKPFPLTISEYEEGEDVSFPADVVGVWEGEEMEMSYVTFTFTVNSDGTAVLEITDYYDEVYTFNFTCHEEGHKIGDSQYNFTYDDDSDYVLNIYSISGYDAYISFSDCEIIDDICYTYLAYSYSLEIYKIA